MKSRFFFLGAVLTALFLAACASAPRLVWYKAGASAADFDTDYKAARAHAASAPVDRGASTAAHMNAAVQKPGTQAAVQANTAWAVAAGQEQVAQQQRAFESFLAGRGWQKVAVDSLTTTQQSSGFPLR